MELSQLRALRALELEPATLGSPELAHLGQGGKRRAVGASAHLACVSAPDPLPKSHCRACEGSSGGGHMLCRPPAPRGWALTHQGPAVMFCQTLAEAPALCITGWWAAVSQGPSMSSVPEKNSRGVWLQAGGVVTPETCSCCGGRSLGSQLSVWGVSAWQNHVGKGLPSKPQMPHM